MIDDQKMSIGLLVVSKCIGWDSTSVYRPKTTTQVEK